MIAQPLSSPAAETAGDEQEATCGYGDALEAVLEALDIPHGATIGDQRIRDAILVERAAHAMVMLNSILCAGHPAPDVPWSVSYLRERLAEQRAEGYKTWDQRMAELDTLKAQDGGR